MAYALEDIARALKAAREAKGLSQRALSQRVGLTQAHISRIEGATVDIRLSSLIELARALDLDVTLVPRQAVPAVKSVVLSATEAAPLPETVKAVRTLNEAAQQLSFKFPEVEVIRQIQSTVRAFENLRLSYEATQKLREAADAFQRTAKSLTIVLPKISPLHEGLEKIQRQHENLKQIAQQIDSLRNSIAHAQAITPARPRPAYRLDDDEDNDA